MSETLRAVGYTGTRQTLNWPADWNNEVTVYLWGGGGGSGGGDGGYFGGGGGGGSYIEKTFSLQTGDEIEISVGGAGGGGLGNRGSAPGGSAGASLVEQTEFNTLNLLSNPAYVRYTNAAYCGFLNTYGIWNSNITSETFDITTSANFPSTQTYTFTGSADNYATVFLDGVAVLSIPGYQSSYSSTISVTAGTHSVRILAINTGGPGSVGLTIDGGTSFSGGAGGSAGPGGSSGGGGGSGGATVLRLNGTTLAVAGGGAGGAGAGYRGGGPGNAPGPNGNYSTSAGQNGGSNPGDGGGGGAGAGGALGGNAGYWGGASSGNPGGIADVYGQAGVNGTSLGDSILLPSGTIPGGRNNLYYPGQAGRGGAGTAGDGVAGQAGYAAFVFTTYGVSVHNGGDFVPAKEIYVNQNGQWININTISVKNNGVWQSVFGSYAPNFTSIAGGFGIAPRAAPVYVPPPDPGNTGGGDGGQF